MIVPAGRLAFGACLVVGTAFLALFSMRRRFMVVTVIGRSMLPTYDPGERVLVRRVPAHAVRRRQVVVFEEDGQADSQAGGPRGWMIKRVVATSGDPVPRNLVPLLADRPEAAVPVGHLVVLGDNPNGSFDSRQLGYVPGDRVLGVVTRRLGAVGRGRDE